MNIEERNAFIISMYQQGAKGREITEAIGISTPTIYRVIRDAGLDFRHKSRQDNPSPHRSASLKAAWEKKKTPEERSITRVKRDLPTIDILRRLNLTLGKDLVGQFLSRDDKKVYLSDAEFDLLIKKPMELIKAISSRINAAMGAQ